MRGCVVFHVFVFFFQAEDGIRDDLVTGVQTCALPISPRPRRTAAHSLARCGPLRPHPGRAEIGRASCRESVDLGGRRIIKKKKKSSKQDCVWDRIKSYIAKRDYERV